MPPFFVSSSQTLASMLAGLAEANSVAALQGMDSRYDGRRHIGGRKEAPPVVFGVCLLAVAVGASASSDDEGTVYYRVEG